MSSKKPEIRFEAYNTDWDQHKLKSISTYSNGGSYENEVSENEKYELITLKSVDMNGNLVSSGRYIDKNVSTLRKDTLVMILSEQSPGLLGKTAIIPVDNRYVLNQRVAEISPNDQINPYFLSMSLNTNQRYFSKLGAGTKVHNISKSNVENFALFFPTPIEQDKIGSFFRQLNESLSLHQHALDLLKQRKKAFLQKMFPKKGESFPEIRFSGFSAEWKLSKLGDLANFSKGKGYKKGDLRAEGIPIILYGRLYTQYKTVIDNVDTYVKKTENTITSNGNEVIVPASGETSEDISRASVVIKPGIIIGGDLNIIIPSSEIDSTFLALTISNGDQKKELSRRAQGKSVVHIRNSNLKNVNLVYPNIKEQTKIGDFFNEMDTSITNHEQKLVSLKQMKKAFLQKMFV